MNMNEMTREQISALADGELPVELLDAALAASEREGGKVDWDIYHQIGDLLRSDDMAVRLSPGFAAKMAARLDAEPTILAPVAIQPQGGSTNSNSTETVALAGRPSHAKRWALPSMAAAAAMAAVAFFTTPQLMVAMKGGGGTAESATKVASDVDQSSIVAASAPEGVVIRDPRIDDYLMAHQRISPSVYSTTQFARSANFATDPNK